MDLKQFAGKHVNVQFKVGQGWYMVNANHLGKPELTQVKNKGELVPVLTPFIEGTVDDAGCLALETGRGGSIRVMLCTDAIFSVTEVTSPAAAPPPSTETSRIVVPAS